MLCVGSSRVYRFYLTCLLPFHLLPQLSLSLSLFLSRVCHIRASLTPATSYGCQAILSGCHLINMTISRCQPNRFVFSCLFALSVSSNASVIFYWLLPVMFWVRAAGLPAPAYFVYTALNFAVLMTKCLTLKLHAR